MEAPPIKCECGVKANYGIVPLELGIGHWCGHMVEYDEVGYCCGQYEIQIILCTDLCSIFLFEQSTRKCKWDSYGG